MIFPDKNGEVVTISEEVYAEILASANEIDNLDRLVQAAKDELASVADKLDRAKAHALQARQEAALLIPRTEVMIPIPGAVLERVPGKRENRAVKKDAIEKLDASLPGRVRKREVATIDADLLTPKQRELADITVKFPTVKEIDDAAMNLTAKGIALAHVLEIPPDPPDVLKLTYVTDDDDR